MQDILVLGRECPHGPDGISRCFKLLAPNDFDVIRLNDSCVQAVLVNRRLLKRIDSENLLSILREKVFPYMSTDEILRVDLNVSIIFDLIEINKPVISTSSER